MKRRLLLLEAVIFLVTSLTGCSKECEHSNVIIDQAVSPTCTEHGLTDGKHCSDCGSILVAQQIIEPLGHEIVIDEAVPATCTNDGMTSGAHCSRCETVIKAKNIIEHLGHSIVIDEGVDPTCTKHGLSQGSHCETCGEILEAQEVIEPLGHDFVIDEKVEPTAIEEGKTEGAHCKVCGEILVAQQTIGALGYQLNVQTNNYFYGYIEGNLSQRLMPGEKSTPLTAVPNLGYKFKSWSNGSKENPIEVSIADETTLVANFEIDSLELPVVEISTENGAAILSKEEYVKCNVSVSNSAFNFEFENLSGKIRGRGNSTWLMPKKPYKLKFDKKIDLFGHGEAKTWTLIANYCDQSLARNYLAYELGRLLGSEYCTTTQFIDLYVNGTYQGVYLICEQNEAGTNRVEIDESITDVNTGYLLEIDRRAPEEGAVENVDYFVFKDKPYVIKSPDTEDKNYNETFLNYIKNYIETSYDAILSKDIAQIESYIDINSFAKSYIVHEMVKSLDISGLSFYLYKDKDGMLKSGPLWDFDISSGNYDYGIDNPGTSYTRLWAKEVNDWYIGLLEVPEYKDLVGQYLKNNYINILREINTSLDGLMAMRNSFERNFDRWDILGKYVWPNSAEMVAISTWEGQVEYLRQWILKSLDFMYNHYNECSTDAYSVTFNSGDNFKIDILNTNDVSCAAIVLDNAWSRDLVSGELLKDGNGKSMFKVKTEDGYRVKQITVSSKDDYDQLITVDEEKNIYQITGITGDISVEVEAEEDVPEPEVTGYNVTFVIDNGNSIRVYPGKDYTVEGELTTSAVVEDMTGDGQINFKVELLAGYEVSSVTINETAHYKAIKGPGDTGADNVYRITKITGDITVVINTQLV